MKGASTKEEFLEISRQPDAPFIRSMSDWKEARDAVKNNGTWRFAASSNTGVLSKCSEEALQQWEDTATYKNGGLANGNYELLKRDVGDAGLVEFFAMHAIEESLLEDYKEYKCEGTGSCVGATSHICTSHC